LELPKFQQYQTVSLDLFFRGHKANTLKIFVEESMAFQMLSCLTCRLRDLRIGELVGTDSAGNKYYQNNNYFFGKFVML